MECEHIVEQVRSYVSSCVEGRPAQSGGCRLSVPLLEPNGDVIYVTLHEESDGSYHVTDGGRLNGILFESTLTTPSRRDQEMVDAIAKRSDLKFDHDRHVFYAVASEDSLGYWIFEMGRTIATVATMVPQPERRRAGHKLSRQVLGQLSREFHAQGLLGPGQVSGRRRVTGVTTTERWVDFSYRRRRSILDEPLMEDVFVIAADLRVATPLKRAQDAVVVAHDLSGREDKPTVRVVHGMVDDSPLDGSMKQIENARRLIESVATSDRIEEYSWDDADSRAALVAATRADLAA